MDALALGVGLEELCSRDTFVTGANNVWRPQLHICPREHVNEPLMSHFTLFPLCAPYGVQCLPILGTVSNKPYFKNINLSKLSVSRLYKFQIQ